MAITNYALNSKNKKDIAAITQLTSNSCDLDIIDFETLGKYEISDIDFVSEGNNTSLPRQWALVLNTNLQSFNDQNGQEMAFNSPNDTMAGDGFVVIPIKYDIFSLMIEGGLYDHPESYIKCLLDALTKKTFYRQTRISLTTLLRENKPDTDVDVGDVDVDNTIYDKSTFYIAHDLESCFNFQLVDNKAYETTDLVNLLQEVTTDLLSDKNQEQLLSEVANLKDRTAFKGYQATTRYDLESDFVPESKPVELSDSLTVSEELDLGDDLVSSSSVSQSPSDEVISYAKKTEVSKSDISEPLESKESDSVDVEVVSDTLDVDTSKNDTITTDSHSDSELSVNKDTNTVEINTTVDTKDSVVEKSEPVLDSENDIDRHEEHPVKVDSSESEITSEVEATPVESISLESMMDIVSNKAKNRKNRNKQKKRIYQDTFAQARQEQKQAQELEQSKKSESKSADLGR